jgi:hypothetical protein
MRPLSSGRMFATCSRLGAFSSSAIYLSSFRLHRPDMQGQRRFHS